MHITDAIFFPRDLVKLHVIYVACSCTIMYIYMHVYHCYE